MIVDFAAADDRESAAINSRQISTPFWTPPMGSIILASDGSTKDR